VSEATRVSPEDFNLVEFPDAYMFMIHGTPGCIYDRPWLFCSTHLREYGGNYGTKIALSPHGEILWKIFDGQRRI